MDGSSLGEKNKTKEEYLEKPYGPLLATGDIVIELCLEAATNWDITKIYEIPAIKIDRIWQFRQSEIENG